MEATAGSGSGFDVVPGGVGLLPQEHCNKDKNQLGYFPKELAISS